MTNLINLPGDVQRLIAEQGVTNELRGVNRELQQRVEPVFQRSLKLLCDQQLETDEIYQALPVVRSILKSKFDTANYSSDLDNSYQITVNRYDSDNLISSEIILGSIFADEHRRNVKMTFGIRSRTGLPRHEPVEMRVFQWKKSNDLNLIYNTYKRRILCQRVDPNYARRETLKIFDKITQKYLESRDSTASNLKFYVYLIANAKILNIKINPRPFEFTMGPGDDKISTSINPKIKFFSSEVDRLTKTVRSGIESLP